VVPFPPHPLGERNSAKIV